MAPGRRPLRVRIRCVLEHPELCMCPVKDRGPPTHCSGPCDPSYNAQDTPLPSPVMYSLYFLPNLVRSKQGVTSGWLNSWILILKIVPSTRLVTHGPRAFLMCISSAPQTPRSQVIIFILQTGSGRFLIWAMLPNLTWKMGTVSPTSQGSYEGGSELDGQTQNL